MAQIISRLFPNSTNAASAAEDVLANRFGENEVFTIESEPKATMDDIVAQISQAGLPKAAAAAYAEKVKEGATLVVVHAPFGSAVRATVVLDRHQPLPTPESVAPSVTSKLRGYDSSAPFSSFYQWPTLISDPTPLSSYFRWTTLSQYSLSRALGWSVLLDEPAPLSRRLNWRLLSDTAAPLSERFKWTLLTSEGAPLSKRLNWSTLSTNFAPLSSLLSLPLLLQDSGPKSASGFSGWSNLSDFSFSRALGFSELSNSPTPFSNWLKWSVLSNEAAPLSKRLNWKTLTSNPSPLSTILNLPALTQKR